MNAQPMTHRASLAYIYIYKELEKNMKYLRLEIGLLSLTKEKLKHLYINSGHAIARFRFYNKKCPFLAREYANSRFEKLVAFFSWM
jgi:hypothetical protein